MSHLKDIFEKNKAWAEKIAEDDPTFFSRLSSLQKPKYLWIGCSDSRVPANQITGLLPGEIFVHRNVGNIVSPTDLNCMSVIQYAVEVLGVEHIIVCGHYGCGAVKAAAEGARFGLIDFWLSAIRRVKEKFAGELESCPDITTVCDRLCELNVMEQARSVCLSDFVQDTWEKGKPLTVHGWIYRLTTGRLQELGLSVASNAELSEFENSISKAA